MKDDYLWVVEFYNPNTKQWEPSRFIAFNREDARDCQRENKRVCKTRVTKYISTRRFSI